MRCWANLFLSGVHILTFLVAFYCIHNLSRKFILVCTLGAAPVPCFLHLVGLVFPRRTLALLWCCFFYISYQLAIVTDSSNFALSPAAFAPPASLCHSSMAKCCTCGPSGTCKSCVCVKNSRKCTNCAPRAKLRCRNLSAATCGMTSASQPIAPPISSSTQRNADPPASCPELSTAATGTTREPRSSDVANTSAESSVLISGTSPEQSLLPGGDTTLLLAGLDDSRHSFDENIWNSPADDIQACFQEVYNECVQWERNLVMIPYGSAGSSFVNELARLISAFAADSPLRPISWTAVTVACQLLLQRPHPESRAAENATHITRRMKSWSCGRLEDILDEARCIQAHLPAGKRRQKLPDTVNDTTFSRRVFAGKVHSAARMVGDDSPGSVLGMEDSAGGDKTVREVLHDKHPSPSPAVPGSLVAPTDSQRVNPILFERITPSLIKFVSRSMKGAAGPSGLDSEAWTRMLTCFGPASNRLCTALADSARVLCTANIEPSFMEAFTAARLIPLDKSPGVRPIAVGEVFRRIIGRAIMKVIESDVRAATAPRQLCVGMPAACEAAVQAMAGVFGLPETEAVLLIDASNAFNSLNRNAALHNVPALCPALGQVFKNTYGAPCRLFVAGGGELLSREGTCQGDPLAMAIYAVAVMPLINKLSHECPNTTQLWYADDDSAAGTLQAASLYWSKLLQLGPDYGYHPSPEKTVLLVKPSLEHAAQELFAGTGVRIVTDGCIYLGGALGSERFLHTFVSGKVDKWVRQVEHLSELATTQPHAAYTVLVRSIISRWRYCLRAVNCSPDLFTRLDDAINNSLLPAIAGVSLSSDDPLRQLMGLPCRRGGLGIPPVAPLCEGEYSQCTEAVRPIIEAAVPQLAADSTRTAASRPDAAEELAEVELADEESSEEAVERNSVTNINNVEAMPLNSGSVDIVSADRERGDVRSLDGGDASEIWLSLRPPRHTVNNETADESLTSSWLPHRPPSASMEIPSRDASVSEAVMETRQRLREGKKKRDARDIEILATVHDRLTPDQRFLVEIAGEKGVSSWLTVEPRSAHGTTLNKSDFRDAVALRYGLPLDGLPTNCVCGADLSTDHAMVCPCGGYPTARHNEIRDLIAELLRSVSPDVAIEPNLLPFGGETLAWSTSNRSQEARLDVRARGFWTRQQEAFFDIRVTHPRATLLSREKAMSQLERNEREKKRHYAERVNQIDRGTFTPLVFATNGMIGKECSVFLKALVGRILEKNADLVYSVVVNHLRCRLSFCLLRWCITCLRGSRSSYRSKRSASFVNDCRVLSRA